MSVVYDAARRSKGMDLGLWRYLMEWKTAYEHDIQCQPTILHYEGMAFEMEL